MSAFTDFLGAEPGRSPKFIGASSKIVESFARIFYSDQEEPLLCRLMIDYLHGPWYHIGFDSFLELYESISKKYPDSVLPKKPADLVFETAWRTFFETGYDSPENFYNNLYRKPIDEPPIECFNLGGLNFEGEEIAGISKDDFGRRHEPILDKDTELEMHKNVPLIFEVLDYFCKKTVYKYNEKLQTHCCHLGNSPVFHMAMTVPKIGIWSPNTGDIRNEIFGKVTRAIGGSMLGFGDAEDDILREFGESFFKMRYPRFFEPAVSLIKGHEFISEGERKMAFLFQRDILHEVFENYRDFCTSGPGTKIVGLPDDDGDGPEDGDGAPIDPIPPDDGGDGPIGLIPDKIELS